MASLADRKVRFDEMRADDKLCTGLDNCKFLG
jgi:hypothetical protein